MVREAFERFFSHLTLGYVEHRSNVVRAFTGLVVPKMALFLNVAHLAVNPHNAMIDVVGGACGACHFDVIAHALEIIGMGEAVQRVGDVHSV